MPISKENIDAGVESDSFYLATGGDVMMSRELKSVIDLPAKEGKRPDILPVGVER